MRPYAIDIEYKKIDITISVSYLRTPAATQRVGDDQYQPAAVSCLCRPRPVAPHLHLAAKSGNQRYALYEDFIGLVFFYKLGNLMIILQPTPMVNFVAFKSENLTPVKVFYKPSTIKIQLSRVYNR